MKTFRNYITEGLFGIEDPKASEIIGRDIDKAKQYLQLKKSGATESQLNDLLSTWTAKRKLYDDLLSFLKSLESKYFGYTGKYNITKTGEMEKAYADWIREVKAKYPMFTDKTLMTSLTSDKIDTIYDRVDYLLTRIKK